MHKRIIVLAAIAAAASFLTALADEEPGAKPKAGPDPAAMFAELDSNGDGQLNEDEVPDEQKRLFARLVRVADKNDDGKLSREEFAAGLKGPSEKGDAPERPDRPQRPRDRGKGGEGRPGLEQIFGRLDQNSDGKVTLDEVPDERREGFKRLIERGDKDGDEALSKEEFAATMPGDGARPDRAKRPKARPEGRPEPAQFFKRLDRNSDGKVTLDEAPEERQDFVKLLIKRGDKDNDQALSLEEFSAMPRPGGRPEGAPGRPPGDNPKSRNAPGRGRPQVGLFQALDGDRDGKLSGEEISAAAEMIRKLDSDGDGFVTVEELMAAGAQRREKE